MNNLALDPEYAQLLAEMKEKMARKLDEINDKFDFASYYKENWVSEDRIILRTATAPDREIRK
jgi:hypothetical protein